MEAQLVPRAVSISYFDPFEVFDNVKEEFLESIPFQNVHWKAPNGAVRTIDELPVNLVSESKDLETKSRAINFFIRFIVVNCKSVDEYRAKVRPLIRKWLPATEGLAYKEDILQAPLPLILLYSNSEVIDSNLFKSIPLMDKFNKDFPNVSTLELKSVYKSPKEKKEFWDQLTNQLKNFILDIFQRRLAYYQNELASSEVKTMSFEDKLSLREILLELYMILNMHQQATESLDIIYSKVSLHVKGEMPNGTLENPFGAMQGSRLDCNSICIMLVEKKLTKFQFHRYFFIRKFELLLKDVASKVKVFKVYKLLRDYCYTIGKIFRNDKTWLQFKYEFLDRAIKFLPKENSVEIRGELLLAKRDCWVEGVQATTNFRIINKSFSKTIVGYDFEKHRDTFATEEIFQECYFSLTREILSLYNRCGGKRQRIVDILSIEIGNLHFQRNEYDKAVSIFLSCHEYYMQSKWDLIGKNILRVFVDSLTKCSGVKNLEIEEEAVPISTVLSNAFLNILKISSCLSERKKWWNNFVETQKSQPASLMYTTEGLFKVDIIGDYGLTAPNTYALHVEIDNQVIPQEIQVDSMRLSLKNSEDAFIQFNSYGVAISQTKKIYELVATEISFGSFLPVSFEIDIGEATFIKQFLDNDMDFIEIHPLYSPSNVAFTVQQARELKLGENAIELCCRNLVNAKSLEFDISVEGGDVSSGSLVSFAKDKVVHSLKIKGGEEKTKLVYYIKEPATSFEIRAKLSFIGAVSNKKHSEERICLIKCYLPISVSVEDIFKRDLFIFKFLLNSSRVEEPVILFASELLSPEGVDHYDISREYKPESFEYLIADSNEYCLNCYQIRTSQRFDPADTFYLKVTYNTLKEQLDQLVTDAVLVQGNVEWYGEFEVWKSFWDFFILPKLQYDYRVFQRTWNIILSKGTFDLKSISKRIKKLAISSTVSERMIECLRNVSDGVQLSEIDINAYTKNLAASTLIVPVEVPKIEQLFFIELLKKFHASHEVGTPIPFTIKVQKLGDKWISNNEAGKFIFEITSSNEWLVHGKKRMMISSDYTEFAVQIIPLKKGYLNYPRVEITSVEGNEPGRIDNPSMFETILVF